MALSLSEKLTLRFYGWERHCRGWYVYDTPVHLESPFEPFGLRQVRPVYVDDGLRESLFSSIASYVSNGFKRRKKEAEEELSQLELNLEPFFYPEEDGEPDMYIFGVSLPRGEKVRVEETEQLLLMLSFCIYPVSFEIISREEVLRIQVVSHAHDASQVYSQLKAYFPTVVIENRVDELWEILPDDTPSFAIELGLREEFMRPLMMVKSYELDPYKGLFAVMERLLDQEQAVLQILFSGAVNAWAPSILNAVTDNKGSSFFMDAPEMPLLAKEKVSAPLFAVAIRIIGTGDTNERAKEIADMVASSVAQVSRSQYNTLDVLETVRYGEYDFIQDLVYRRSHRLGMLLNARELATLVHLPNHTVHTSTLEREVKKSKVPPAICLDKGVVLGRNLHQGIEREVRLPCSLRLKHMHLIGATGTGKSTLLLSLIAQDMEAGNGVALLDPHGDLVESVLKYVPQKRMKDVVVIDPSDTDFPVGFNILTAHSETEKDILSSDLVAVFRRLSTSWGDQMNSVFANAILAFLESRRGGTLLDLRRFLIEKKFRDKFLSTVTDPSVIYYWLKEFPLLKSGSIGPILTRLDSFLRPKLIRNMVAQKKGLDFEKLLNEQKIVLIKLPQGLIGSENSYLLGTFLVSKLHQAALARQAQEKEKRKDFFLYIDEFQHFITPSMTSIPSGARKYHLGLVLTHQDMGQLLKHDLELSGSLIANAATRVCFRLGETDAKRFSDGFSFFDAHDLQNLSTGEAIARVVRLEYDFSLLTIPLIEALPEAEERAEIIIKQSRQKYGTPKEDVEKLFELLHENERPEEKEKVIIIPPPTPVVPAGPEAVEDIKVEPEPAPKAKPEKPKREARLFVPQEKKEESQHRYLQSLIKRMSESRGFKASIEEPTPDGKGRVDVLLERNGKRIAVEISITTTEAWELGNIQKCLFAGYEVVVACSPEKKTLQAIQKEVEKNVAPDLRQRVLYFQPDDLFTYLNSQLAQEASTETRVKGYRVKVTYEALPDKEADLTRVSVAKVVAEAIKRQSKNS